MIKSVSLYYCGDLKMRKKDNPFYGRVKKCQWFFGQIDFEHQELPRWGKRKGCIIEHKGNKYLEVLVESMDYPVYILDGEEIDSNCLENFISERESLPPVRTFNLVNIKDLIVTTQISESEIMEYFND